MKAWKYVGDGLPIELCEATEPRPGPGDVVLEVKAAGICHSDFTYLDGTISSLLAFSPITLGHEVAGVVSHVGAEVSGFEIGDRVAVNSVIEGPGTSRDGGFQPRLAVQSELLVKIPSSVPWDQAAIATDAGATSYHASMVRGQVSAGDRVGIIGMGGLGTLAVQAAVASGAQVYVADTKTGIHDYARELGAAGASSSLADFGDEPFDTICDFVGGFGTTAQAIDLVRRYGRIVIVGLAQNRAELNMLRLTTQEISLLGSNGGTTDDLGRVLELMESKKLHCPTSLISFEEVGDAIARLERGDLRRGRFVVMY